MPRPFDFPPGVIRQAIIRQSEWKVTHCGVCGADLNWLDKRFAHHVVPNQVGVVGIEESAFLRTYINCVVLCVDCHNRVHENGKWANGAYAPPSYFEYSHGNRRKEHLAWVKELDFLDKRLWKLKLGKNT